MKQLQSDRQDIFQSEEGCVCGLRIRVLRIHTRLYHLDVPVTEFIPDKIVDLADCDAELVFFHILSDVLHEGVHERDDGSVLGVEVAVLRIMEVEAIQVHLDESRCIPYLIREVPRVLDSLPVESHVISRCVSCHQGKSQRVCAVLVDDFERIDTVSKGLRHLSALVITHKTVDQHMVERHFSGLLNG